MKCLECQDMLQRRLDGEAIDVSSAMRHHLALCPSCRLLHASGPMLLRELKTVPVPALSKDFSERLTDLVMADRRDCRRRRRLRLVITAALAASLLVTSLAGYYLLSFPWRAFFGPISGTKKTMEEVPVDHPEELPRLAKSVDDTRQALASLSERWADRAREKTVTLLAAAKPVDIPSVDFLHDMAEPLEPAARSLQQAGHGVAEGLQPVATSAGRAWAYLLRDLPVFPESH